MDELERMLSSTLPGHCAQEFDSWAQCADFLGPSIPDPAADCGWLEEATYAGMPLEASDAPRVKAEWYGTREGQVEWVSVPVSYTHLPFSGASASPKMPRKWA